MAVSLISLLITVGTFVPATARASVFGDILKVLMGSPAQADTAPGGGNVQTMALLRPAMNIDPSGGRGGGDVTIVDESALMPKEGPAGTPTEYDRPKNSTISLYTVVEGDTLNGIAKLFRVSPDTILWANDLPRNAVLKVGQMLVILPVTGVRYTVKSGDTLASIAKKFGADAADIGNFNGIDESMVIAGMKLIIPDGEIAVAAVVAAPASTKPAKSILAATLNAHTGTTAQVDYYIVPLAHYVKTQGIHGYNGVDLAAPVGTHVLAAAAGTVLIAKEGGWNAGYGNYVVIKHGNGSQTLYAHLSSVSTYVGATVVQSQVIGTVGSTGKSTGPHLHFEIRDGIRNPF
ncbi:MAG: peptidoglycan DD-metalloendopeptidase family protein [Patescibacteria group bacterium]